MESAGTEEQRRQTAAALNLLQRLPPQDLQKNLSAFHKIAPHLEQSLAPYISQPLHVELDPECNRYFVACDYNCDRGRYRSPWSNTYFPPPEANDADEDAYNCPSERLRRLEETFNEVFDAYKTNYYEGGVSSVYLWDLDEGFAAAFLIHKEATQDGSGYSGMWDATHVIEVRESPSSNFVEYKLLTSVLVHLQVGEPAPGEAELGALLTRQAESKADRRKKAAGEDLHILHIGRMIEEMEIAIRQSLDSVYMAKQNEVLNAVRSLDSADPWRHLRPPPGVLKPC